MLNFKSFISNSFEILTSDLLSPVLATVLGLVTTENATDLLTGGGLNLLLSPNSLVLNISELPEELIYKILGLTGCDIANSYYIAKFLLFAAAV